MISLRNCGHHEPGEREVWILLSSPPSQPPPAMWGRNSYNSSLSFLHPDAVTLAPVFTNPRNDKRQGLWNQ
jgi:hypothetical protein